MDLAVQIEQSINRHDPSIINNAFHLPSFISRVVLSQEASSETAKLFNERFVEGLTERFDFGGIVIQQVEENYSYSFVKYYRRGKSHHLIFRLLADDGLNYHDYELQEIDGLFRIVDVYIYMTGECFSETLKRLYIANLHNNIEDVRPVSLIDRDYLEALEIIEEIRESVEEGRVKDATQLFRSIPEKYRNEKAFQIAWVQLAKNLDDQRYLEAIEAYQQLFPADPSLFLIALDGYFLKGHYVKALRTVDKLEEFVGPDPALNLYRGNLYFSIGDVTSSRNCFRRLTEEMPEFELGYLGLLNACIEGYRFDEVLPILDILQFKFQYEQMHIEQMLQEFSDFYTSPHYRDWLLKWQLV